MKVTSHSEQSVMVVGLHGEIDAMDMEGLEASLNKVAEQKPVGVVVDFSGVKYIASMGIALLIKFVQHVRRNGGQARVAAVSPPVRTVLDMVNLKSLVEFDKTVEEGVIKLEARDTVIRG